MFYLYDMIMLAMICQYERTFGEKKHQTCTMLSSQFLNKSFYTGLVPLNTMFEIILFSKLLVVLRLYRNSNVGDVSCTV